jgi:hypothetical protein
VRFATFSFNGQQHVGQVSPDGLQVTPLALSAEQAQRGVLALVDLQAAGMVLPAAAGQSLPVAQVRLLAPAPLPIRNLGRRFATRRRRLGRSGP